MPHRSYLFHDVRLRISADPLVLEVLHDRLGRFAPVNPGERSDIFFEFLPSSQVSPAYAGRPTGQGRPILDPGPGEVLYFEKTDELYLNVLPGTRAVADPASGSVRVAHGPLNSRELWLLSHFFFTVAFSDLLKRRGYFMVHSAGLAQGEMGLLIAGESGSGKTTLALALLRAGFGFLGDDTVFLDRHQHVLAFPDEIDVAPSTARFFPELAGLAHDTLPGEPPKRRFIGTTVYPAAPCWRCQPAVLVFPQRSPAAESVLGPMPKDQALLRLTCNILRTELKSSQAHLDALAGLADRCRCYELKTGRDFQRLPSLLGELLA